jgi:hypothetical protein
MVLTWSTSEDNDLLGMTITNAAEGIRGTNRPCETDIREVITLMQLALMNRC